MSLRDLFRRLIGQSSETPSSSSGVAEYKPSSISRTEASAWLEALEAGCLNPPQDLHDPGGWDTYWRNQMNVGAIDQGFADMMSSDAELPGLLVRRDCRTILCAGNGLSTEALSLALRGFHVTALDISAVPADVMWQTIQSPEHPLHRVSVFSSGDDRTISFGELGPLDRELCPRIHESADHDPRGGGTLAFVTGDLTNADVCPGPFDVVIERRTVQLLPDAERIPALERLVARLAQKGLFVGHQHSGRWRPGDPATHYAKVWLGSAGFMEWSVDERATCDSAPRVARLMFSTG